MRAIDADAFKKYITDACEDMKHLFNDGGAFAKLITESFCKDIDEQPTIEPQRWIPCSERLPEECPYYYLVTVANHGTFFTTTFPNKVEVVKWDYDKRKGRGSFHWCDDRTVIAWMPLPESYRGNKDDE